LCGRVPLIGFLNKFNCKRSSIPDRDGLKIVHLK
jgi:hypothetical protein